MNIFEISVTGTVLIFAVILFRAVGKKRLPMRTFTVLWHVALLRLFLPVKLPSPISAASIGQKLIRSLTETFSRADSAGARRRFPLPRRSRASRAARSSMRAVSPTHIRCPRFFIRRTRSRGKA